MGDLVSVDEVEAVHKAVDVFVNGLATSLAAVPQVFADMANVLEQLLTPCRRCAGSRRVASIAGTMSCPECRK